MPPTNNEHNAGTQNSPLVRSTESDHQDDELEYMLLHGVDAMDRPTADSPTTDTFPSSRTQKNQEEDEDISGPANTNSDVQGALGLYAEATQDLATAGVELALGRHFACADYCNQAVEKAAQAVSLLRFGRRTMYDHDLHLLGAAVGAPEDIQDEMALLTPFHPETFYADTPPEEADEVISAEQASHYIQTARHILRWARSIVL